MSAALLLEVLTMDSERYVASSEVIETIVVDVLAISRFVGCGDAPPTEVWSAILFRERR